ncbi:hypothetical protein D9757_003894 [Collybiopsis confluens]|uniref:Uncharacterized protein n=1 Tax=Collybiopsis confluens TaxID=2823264 RepID=A0A8H5HVP6_9AGAR|nr:hypothetical protein D9757_003894 [Collybiopsis confluens]
MAARCSVCQRFFDSQESLRSHLRNSSKLHYVCTKCDFIYGDDQALKEHMKRHAIVHSREDDLSSNYPPTPTSNTTGRRSAHSSRSKRSSQSSHSTPTGGHSLAFDSPLLYCQPCHKKFQTEVDLQEHFRGSPAHPKCGTCPKGFLNQDMCDNHRREAHPHPCQSCGVAFSQRKDLMKHFKLSPNHPSCRACEVSFVNDGEYDKHCREEHANTRCQQCERQYDVLADLQHHFLTSKKHPTCGTCKVGFENDIEFEKHNVSVHSEPLSERKEGVELLEIMSQTSNTSIVTRSPSGSPIEESSENSARISLWSSCVFPDDTVASSIPDSNESFTLSKAKWEAASEEDLIESATESIAKTAADYLLLEDVPSTTSQLTMRPRSLWTVNPASRPPEKLPSPDVYSPLGLEPIPSISPEPSTPVSQSTIAPALKDPWPPWRLEVPPRPSVPHINTRVKGKSAALESVHSSVSTMLDQTLARHGFKGNDSLLTIEAPGFLSSTWKNSPVINFSTSETSSLGPPRSTGSDNWITRYRPSSLQHSSLSKRPETPPPSSSSTVNDRSTTESSISPATTVASFGFHCRLCMREPCVDTTVSMCGHLFCGKCIAESVMTVPECPVCHNALLLYCLFKLDLSH